MPQPPKAPGPPIVLRAARMPDVVKGSHLEPGALVVQGDRSPRSRRPPCRPTPPIIDLGDVTLLPGLMDMEINLLMGGPSGGNRRARRPGRPGLQDAARPRQLPHHAERRVHHGAQSRAVRQDRRRTCSTWRLPARSTRAGSSGPRIVPAGHAITPTGGHLDPTMFQRLGPGIMPLSVEEGIANGVPEVRKAVRYQLKYGAKVIKISASGGVMSHSGAAGAQQYSDEELAAIVDEAHRRGHQGGGARARRRGHPGLHPGRASTASSTARSRPTRPSR